jgi:hypothetical protein
MDAHRMRSYGGLRKDGGVAGLDRVRSADAQPDKASDVQSDAAG